MMENLLATASVGELEKTNRKEIDLEIVEVPLVGTIYLIIYPKEKLVVAVSTNMSNVRFDDLPF